MRPAKSHRLLSSETGSAGRSPSRPERSSVKREADFSKPCHPGDPHLTGRLLSCSRSPRICTKDGNVGLSLGSPCQQPSMMPYLPVEGSTSQQRRSCSRPELTNLVVCHRIWNKTMSIKGCSHISGDAVSGALILKPSLRRLQNSSSICTPGYGDAPGWDAKAAGA